MVSLIDTLVDGNGLATAIGENETESEKADLVADEPQFRRRKRAHPAKTVKKVKHGVNKSPRHQLVRQRNQRPGGCDLHLQWALIAMYLVEAFTVPRKNVSVTRTGEEPARATKIANLEPSPIVIVLAEMVMERETEIVTGTGTGIGLEIEKLVKTDMIVGAEVEMLSVIAATERENETEIGTATGTETERGVRTDVGTEAENENKIETAIETSIATEIVTETVTEIGTDETEVLDDEMMIDGTIAETVDVTETEVTFDENVSQFRLIDMYPADSCHRHLFEWVAIW